MPLIWWSELSKADADSYRDAVVAREKSRLAELAGWMEATGGPLQKMDASIASLVPLWKWYMSFVEAGYPGVPPTATGQWWIDDGTEPLPNGNGYSTEAIGHYIMLVCRRIDPTAHWVVERTFKDDIDYQKAGITLCGGFTLMADDWAAGLIGDIQYSPVLGKQSARPDALLEMLARRLSSEIILPEYQEPGPCVLPPPQPTPDPAPVLWLPADPVILHYADGTDSPRQRLTGTALRSIGVLPVATSASDGSPTSSEEEAEEMAPPLYQLLGGDGDIAIWKGPSHLDDDPDVRTLQPMDPDIIARHLQALGFQPEGPLHDAAAGPEDEEITQHWVLDADGVILELFTIGVRGTVRYLQAEVHTYPCPALTRALTGLVDLARTLHAWIGNSDDDHGVNPDLIPPLP